MKCFVYRLMDPHAIGLCGDVLLDNMSYASLDKAWLANYLAK